MLADLLRFGLSCMLVSLLVAPAEATWTLRIETTDPNTLPMEPLSLSISLSNDSDHSIFGYGIITPGSGYILFAVSREDEPFRMVSDGDVYANVSVEPAEFAPGYRVEAQTFLYFGRRAKSDPLSQYAFPIPGTYKVKGMKFDIKNQMMIESNVLSVSIRQPTGVDMAAYDYLRRHTSSRLLRQTVGYSRGKTQWSVIRKQEEFIKKFPGSRYARYVHDSLGRTYLNGLKHEYDLGITHLEKAASVKDYFLADRALARLVMPA